MHISGVANNAVSFSGVVISLNNNESNNLYHSASTSTLHIVLLELGNLFYVKYKYGLFRYPGYISLIFTGRCVPFNTFLCITFKILSISVCFGKYFWTSLLVLINLPVLTALGIEIYLAFDISLVLYLLDMENFPQNPY